MKTIAHEDYRTIFWWEYKMIQPPWRIVWQFLTKLTHRIIQISHSEVLIQRIKMYAHPKICILKYGFVRNSPKPETAKGYTAHGQINKLQHIHNTEHCLVMKGIHDQCTQQRE